VKTWTNEKKGNKEMISCRPRWEPKKLEIVLLGGGTYKKKKVQKRGGKKFHLNPFGGASH